MQMLKVVPIYKLLNPLPRQPLQNYAVIKRWRYLYFWK